MRVRLTPDWELHLCCHHVHPNRVGVGTQHLQLDDDAAELYACARVQCVWDQSDVYESIQVNAMHQLVVGLGRSNRSCMDAWQTARPRGEADPGLPESTPPGKQARRETPSW